MHRRKWLIIAIAAVCVVLVAGIVGGVAYAQTNTPAPSATTTTTTTTTAGVPSLTVTANGAVTANQTDVFLQKLAGKLGVDEQALKDAIQQTKKEMADQALANKLDALVKKGVLTQEQADQYKAWWQSRPDVPIGPQAKLGPMGKGFRGMGPRSFGGCFPGGPGWQKPGVIFESQ